MLTGRLAPNFYTFFCDRGGNRRQGGVISTPEMVKFQKIFKECDPSAIKTLNYRYLYINESWPQGLEEKCLANNDLELKFKAKEWEKFIRIYQVLWEK